MFRGIVQIVDEWLGPIFILIITIIVVVGFILLISLSNAPAQWCQPSTNTCITPAVPQYCYKYTCITAVPLTEGKAQ